MRVVVVEHAWVHRIGRSGGERDMDPVSEFASLRDREKNLVGERGTGYSCKCVFDETRGRLG